MNQKPSSSAAQWYNLIGQQRESAVKKAFCGLNNICPSTFTLWKHK